MVELKLKEQPKELTVEKGDLVFLKDSIFRDKIYVVNRGLDTEEKLILVNIGSGNSWNSEGQSKAEILSLIREYNGKLIKKDNVKITVEEI